ncbi:MAG: hypothetical protein J0L52_04730 [Caulobacterales bacterium]|nr:hypothetical protein [Caulobacterales bacterium]
MGVGGLLGPGLGAHGDGADLIENAVGVGDAYGLTFEGFDLALTGGQLSLNLVEPGLSALQPLLRGPGQAAPEA